MRYRQIQEVHVEGFADYPISVRLQISYSARYPRISNLHDEHGRSIATEAQAKPHLDEGALSASVIDRWNAVQTYT